MKAVSSDGFSFSELGIPDSGVYLVNGLMSVSYTHLTLPTKRIV